MKFLVGFSVAFYCFIGFVGVAMADCPCNQNPTALGGGWGVTPSSDSSSISIEWQKEIDDSRRSSQYYQPLFYMNPATREAIISVDPEFPLRVGGNRPVFHEEWYAGNPRYFSDVQWKEYIRGGGY